MDHSVRLRCSTARVLLPPEALAGSASAHLLVNGFFIGGFDVLDESGNRVLAKEEVKQRDQSGGKSSRYARQLMACTRNSLSLFRRIAASTAVWTSRGMTL